MLSSRRDCKYQRGNHNPYIEEETKQWPNENGQKDKQRSTKHTYKAKDLVTRTPLQTWSEHSHLKCHSTLYGKYQREREVRKQM
jgi:hypothetical protein